MATQVGSGTPVEDGNGPVPLGEKIVDAWPAERIVVVALGVLAIGAGLLALSTLSAVHDPGWDWIMQHQPPWPVVSIGLLWLVLGVVAVIVSRHVTSASVLLLIAAASATLELGLEINRSHRAFWFSDFRRWYMTSPDTLVPMIGSAFVLAAGGALLIARERRRRPTGVGSVIWAVLAWIFGGLVAGLAAVVGGVAMSMEDNLLGTHVFFVQVGVLLWALAGWTTGRLGAK
jgi:hypothetical protein